MATILVAAEILNPPPSAGGADPESGAWLGFAGALVALGGAVLTMGRVSLAIAYEAREPRQRVAAVDNRPPPTTDTVPVVPKPSQETPAGDVSEPRTGSRRKR
jgi:hypothetical protein